MTAIQQPAQPGIGTEALPTPSLPDNNQPAQPGEGSQGLPTPSLPDSNQPAQPGEGSQGLPTPSLPSQPSRPVIPFSCPIGYRQGVVRNNQSFTDLLLEYDVSFNAMRRANPYLPTTRLAPGTVFCAPPVGTRRLCSNGGNSYILNQNETLDSLAAAWGIAPGTLLRANPNLAPADFIPGRVICLP
ncbi:MAG: LysM peptidoglycan-binding domain-containing protein [Clostridiales bacterium]|nr:LysM peptidoglycan-binding domain-containing protein [Clostridiales bacterium]